MVKLTKAQEFARAWRDVENDERFLDFEAYRNEWNGRVFKAEVVAGGKGPEFLVRGLNGEGQWWLHACNIKDSKTWYPETACVYYDKGQIVEVTLDISYGATFCIGITQGIIDQEKWDSLDQNNLPFRVKDDGSVTGLFA